MRLSLTQYNQYIIRERQNAALLENTLQDIELFRFPFPLPSSHRVKEIYGADGYPLVQNTAQYARDVLLRSFVDESLENGMVAPIYAALLDVQKHYVCDPALISTVLENIFLRSCLSNDETFLEKVVIFLLQERISHHIDWQKMIALTGRFDLLPNLEINIQAALPWWRLTADTGDIKAMKLLADYYLSVDEREKAKYYLTVMVTLMRAVHAGILIEENATLVQAGVSTLADLYYQEGHIRHAKRCYDLIRTPKEDEKKQIEEINASAHVLLEELSYTDRLQAINALFDKHLSAVYLFNSAKGNAIQLLCDECPISFDRYVSLDKNDDVLCSVNPSEWLSQEKIDLYIVISTQGYVYGRVSAQLWQRGKKHKDPLNRGDFVLQPSMQPLDINFLNALINLQRLRLQAHKPFLCALLPDLVQDENTLFLLAHLHPSLLHEKHVENIERLFAENIDLDKILNVTHHFIKTNRFLLPFKYDGRLFAGRNEDRDEVNSKKIVTIHQDYPQRG